MAALKHSLRIDGRGNRGGEKGVTGDRLKHSLRIDGRGNRGGEEREAGVRRRKRTSDYGNDVVGRNWFF